MHLFNKLGIASKPIFSNLKSTLLIHNFLCSKQFELILRLTEYFDGSLIYMFINFKTLSSFQRLNIFRCTLLQDILSEWDYQLAWHEQEARGNKLLRI